MSEKEPNTINLDSMSLDQLSQFRQQEEARLQGVANQYAQLRAVITRLTSSRDSLVQITPSSGGKDIMVPLTSSLYVPGKIKDPNMVTVDLGTGFYVEKSTKDAIAFLERKIRLVEANSSNMMKVIQATRNNVEAVSMAMEGKMLEIRAKQEGARVQAAAAMK